MGYDNPEVAVQMAGEKPPPPKSPKWQEHRLQRCPYQQHLKLFCGEECGKGEAYDCPIWLRESGQIAYALSQKD